MAAAKKRVLVIDDDAGVRLTVRHILALAGCEVQLVCESGKAIDTFRSFEPDVIITDLVMPGIEGAEIIAAIKEKRATVKIIAMSGGARLGRTNILQLARDAGADETLAKPFTVEQLMRAIARVMVTA
jgi:two-component system response regulator (stage 0 sporulation protein F)